MGYKGLWVSEVWVKRVTTVDPDWSKLEIGNAFNLV